MGAGLRGEPNEYTAGIDFDYSVWSAGTQVDLVNVNWDSSYLNTVRFANKTALNTYINSLQSSGIRITNMTYVKPGQDILLPVPYNRVNRYNYLRASNPLMPDSIPGDIQKDYYYFITDCEMVNPTTTRIRLQLDVWQTYIYDVTIGPCYVERGHIGIANENNFNNYGRDYLTVPEGLDIGSDYQVITKRTEEVVALTGLETEPEHDIFVVSTTDLLQDPGSEESPGFKIGPGSLIQGMPSGATFYVFDTYGDFTSWLTLMADSPWITQGIISIFVLPKITRYDSDYAYSATPPFPKRINTLRTPPIRHAMFEDWRNNAGMKNFIPAEYRHLRKFFTAPYMVLELTTWSATPIVIRPEAWHDPNAKIIERVSYMPPNQRVQFYPFMYNATGDQEAEAYWGLTYDELVDLANTLPISPSEREAFIERYQNIGDDYGDYLDLMTQIAGFPALPVVNNMALSYLASNAHSIAYQRTSAEWSQQRALNAAESQYYVASGAIETSQELTGISNNAAMQQTASQNANLQGQALVNAVTGTIGGGTAGAAFGPAGALVGAGSGLASGIGNAVGAGLQTMRNDEATAISNSAARQSTESNNQQARRARDVNQSLAEFGASGDYANTIAGINARVQDAAMIQPSVSGQFGGDAANIANNTMEFSIRWKLIDKAAIRNIGDYWLQFGYAIRAVITPPADLMVMTRFTYWKMAQANISSAMVPEGHKSAIIGILKKGVTVYKNATDVGNLPLYDNDALPGVSY